MIYDLFEASELSFRTGLLRKGRVGQGHGNVVLLIVGLLRELGATEIVEMYGALGNS